MKKKRILCEQLEECDILNIYKNINNTNYGKNHCKFNFVHISLSTYINLLAPPFCQSRIKRNIFKWILNKFFKRNK